VSRLKTSSAPAREKQHGIVYTPLALADAVADRLAHFVALDRETARPLVVADPACGDGALLDAFARAATRRSIRIKLKGYDTDPIAIASASERLDRWSGTDLSQRDFLAGRGNARDLFNQTTVEHEADVFIANPPYVRTQVLGGEQSRALAEQFEIGGRVDLAYAFCMAMVDALPEGGYFAFIVSNKFMTIKAGASLRRFMEAKTEVLEVWDLGDSKLFSAAVLPAVIFGRRNPGGFGKAVPFKSMYSSDKAFQNPVVCNDDIALLRAFVDSDYQAATYGSESLEFRRGVLQVKAKEHTWLLQDAAVKGVQQHFQKSRSRHFSEVLKTKVGIKTTADSIFIRRDWAQLPVETRPEAELLWPVRMTSDIQRWIASPPESLAHQVLYPYHRGESRRKVVDLDDYPRAKAYFETHRMALEGRTYVIESGREWFEPWVAHQPGMWSAPRAIFPEISPTPMLSLDHAGVVPNGTLFWMHVLPPGEQRLLHAAIAIANSDFAVEYYDLLMGTKLYASRRRWNSQHVGALPLPASDADVEIFALLCDEAIAARAANDEVDVRRIESEIDTACRRLLGGGVL
jgi:adenine-specific DNA-methyltransferase